MVKDLLQFEELQTEKDAFGFAEGVFGFRRYLANTINPYTTMVETFYSDASLCYPIVVQNYQAFSSYQLDYCAETADLLSQADLIERKMFSEGNWAGSRACAVFCGLLPGMAGAEKQIAHKNFLYPAFPSIVSIWNQAKSNVALMQDMLLEQMLS